MELAGRAGVEAALQLGEDWLGGAFGLPVLLRGGIEPVLVLDGFPHPGELGEGAVVADTRQTVPDEGCSHDETEHASEGGDFPGLAVLGARRTEKEPEKGAGHEEGGEAEDDSRRGGHPGIGILDKNADWVRWHELREGEAEKAFRGIYDTEAPEAREDTG